MLSFPHMQRKAKTTIHSYKTIFEPLADGGYNVVVPAIPEICTFGKTLAEAKRMASEAILCYLESLIRDRRTLPRDIRRAPFIKRLDVQLERV